MQMRAPDAADAATEFGLVYVDDLGPGIRRRRRGKHFTYVAPDGRRLTDEAELARIRALAIPPAYQDVWICPLPHGHLQATGRDARGRKQYRYHPEWRRVRDEQKFDRMLDFARALPRIRARVERDLATVEPRPHRDTVLATLVRLLDTTLIRVGNDEYARENGSYGLTTLRPRHAKFKHGEVRFHFRGKSGVVHDVASSDPRVLRVLRRCQTLPGQHLFRYDDGDGDGSGGVHEIGSADVNAYLREASGGDFTAKDFRTWHASVLGLALCRCAEPAAAGPGEDARQESVLEQKQRVNRVLAAVASRLGNTVAVCRKAYVHPRVLEEIAQVAPETVGVQRLPRGTGLSREERALLQLLTKAHANADKSTVRVSGNP